MNLEEMIGTIADRVIEKLDERKKPVRLKAVRIDEHLVEVTCPEGVVVLDDDRFFYGFEIAHWVKWSGDDVIYSNHGNVTRVKIEERTKQGHDFSWALAQMKEGKRVRRKTYEEHLLEIVDIHSFKWNCNGGSRETNSLLSEDLLATDWEIA